MNEGSQGQGWPVLSRRAMLRFFTVAAGGALVSACGNTGAPATSVPIPTASTATPAPTAAARTAGTAGAGGATATRATAAGAPAASTRPGTPPARASVTASARATAQGGVPSALSRLLTLVPDAPDLRDRSDGVWFADAARQRRNHGFDMVRSLDAFEALPEEERRRFDRTVGRLPYAEVSGLTKSRVRDGGWLSTIGYDFWQVDRSIYAGEPPRTWARLEGRFDRAVIEGALTTHGYARAGYGGQTFLTRGEDAEIMLADPVFRLALARLNRVVLDEEGLAATPYTALAEAGIDVRAGRAPSLGADPDYVALAVAMGPVVGAALLPGEELYYQRGPGANDPGRARLRRYRLVGLGLRDDGTTHTMIAALLYGDGADAEVDAPILQGRLADYRLLLAGGERQPLRDRAAPGAPEVVRAGGRATLVMPLTIADEANLGLWLEMIFRRDLLFLAE